MIFFLFFFGFLFHTLTELCNRHHNYFRIFPSSRKEPCTQLAVTHILPSPRLLATTCLLFVSIELLVLDITYKLNHTILWVFLSMMLLRSELLFIPSLRCFVFSSYSTYHHPKSLLLVCSQAPEGMWALSCMPIPSPVPSMFVVDEWVKHLLSLFSNWTFSR